MVPLASGLYSCIFNSWHLGQGPLLKETLGSAPTLLRVSATEATALQGSVAPEGGSWAPTRGSPGLDQDQALRMVENCLKY